MMQDGWKKQSESPAHVVRASFRSSLGRFGTGVITPEVRKLGGDNRKRAGEHQRYIAIQTVCEAAQHIGHTLF
jgi:hypothetical protein